VQDVAKDIEGEEVKDDEPLEKEIVPEAEAPMETEAVEGELPPEEAGAPLLLEEQEQEPVPYEFDQDESEEQVPVDLDIPSEREIAEEPVPALVDELPIPDDQEAMDKEPIPEVMDKEPSSEVVDEEPRALEEPVEAAEQVPQVPTEPIEFSPVEDDAFAEPAWMTESGIADRGTEIDSVAPTTAVDIPEEKPKDADEGISLPN